MCKFFFFRFAPEWISFEYYGACIVLYHREQDTSALLNRGRTENLLSPGSRSKQQAVVGAVGGECDLCRSKRARRGSAGDDLPQEGQTVDLRKAPPRWCARGIGWVWEKEEWEWELLIIETAIWLLKPTIGQLRRNILYLSCFGFVLKRSGGPCLVLCIRISDLSRTLPDVLSHAFGFQQAFLYHSFAIHSCFVLICIIIISLALCRS